MTATLHTIMEKIVEQAQDISVPLDNLLIEQEETKPPKAISALIQHLIPRDALFATFLLKCRYVKNHPEVDTCGVNIKDGRVNFYYNEQFINQFPPSQLMFVIAHEFYHIARLHLDRAARRRLQGGLYNVAADMIINENILRDLTSVAGMSLDMPVINGKPIGLRIDKDYIKKVKDPKNWTSESLYKFLEKNKPDVDKPGGPPPVKKDLLRPGQVVRVGQGESYGVIEKVNKDGTYEVKEISKQEAQKRVKAA